MKTLFAVLLPSTLALAGVAGAFGSGFAPGVTTRVSVSSGGAPAIGTVFQSAVLSADGRYVVFVADATNLVGVSGVHVYRHDRENRTTELVTGAAGGSAPTVSKDGNYVAFASAGNVFRRDMTGVTELVSANAAGDVGVGGASSLSGAPGAREISDNGQYVVFASSATNLLAEPYSGVIQQIYRKDMATKEVVRASVDDTGAPGDDNSSQPTISGDGNVVAFRSEAANFSTAATSHISQVFVRDLGAGITRLESVMTSGAAATRASQSPVLSSNGRYLAFESRAQLDPRDLDNGFPGTWDVYLRDRDVDSRTTVLASHSANTASGADSRAPSISSDGRFVGFNSLDDMLVPLELGNRLVDVFLYDRITDGITMVSLNDAGEQANAGSFGPSVSSDGHLVLFASSASNLVPLPASTGQQLYVRDLNRAPIVTAGADVTLNEGVAFSREGSFTDDLDTSTRWTATVDYGDGAVMPLPLSGKTFTLSHLYSVGIYVVTVSVNDEFGLTGTASFQVTISNIEPTVDLGGSAVEVAFPTLHRDGTFSDPGTTEAYSARVDYGDGSGSGPLALSGHSFTLDRIYALPGTYSVIVTVTDSNGGSGTARLDVTLVELNRAPVVTAGADATLSEGVALSRQGSFTDADASTSWTATVAWGDGSVVPLPLNADKTFTLSHLYSVGSYLVTVRVTDGGKTGGASFEVTVNNLAPTVEVGTAVNLAFDMTLHRAGTFTDPGTTETYTATVDYGDNTSGPVALPLTGHSFTLDHVYAVPGTYSVVVTVTDSNGGTGSARLLVTVLGYSYEWLDPVGDSFTVGRNLPVKFTLHAADGSVVFDTSVQVEVLDASGDVVAGPYFYGDQPSRSLVWNGTYYHVNVDTRGYAPGDYTLRVSFSSQTLTGEITLGTTGTTSAVRSRAR